MAAQVEAKRAADNVYTRGNGISFKGIKTDCYDGSLLFDLAGVRGGPLAVAKSASRLFHGQLEV